MDLPPLAGPIFGTIEVPKPSDLLKAIEGADIEGLDEETKKRVYDAAKTLMIEAESDHDFQHRIGHGHNILVLAQIGYDLGLFKILSDAPGIHFTADELASSTAAATKLLQRLLRAMSAYRLIGEDHEGNYYATKCTRALLVTGCEARVRIQNMFATNLINGLPNFLKAKAYQDVNDPRDTVFHQLYDTEIDCLEFIASRPDLLEASQRLYREQSAERKSWIHEASVPKDDFVLEAKDMEAGRVLFVDIGGGMGHQCLELRKAHPDLKGRFVLEDVSTVLELAKKTQPLQQHDIEVVEQDIFQPQSVIGAKVYYMRSVLHNYPDDHCVVILKHLRLAMSSDSVLIIDGMVLAEHQPDYKSIDYDLLMMCAQAGMERSLMQFDRLLRQAGLKIRDVWKYDADDKIIVAIPGDEMEN